MSNEKIINDIETKYQQLGENPETYLKGLLHAKPINYWDYVEADTLLSLQKPRTNFKDEEIFIMYHQVTELFLKMMVHEIKQLVYEPFNEDVWLEKLERLNRYTNMLIGCLLYTSDAADERSSVDLGGRRIIKKKKNEYISSCINIVHTNIESTIS